MNIIDSSGWIEYFIDGPLADRYAGYIENTEQVLTPTIVVYEVYKKILRDAGERPAIEAVALMQKTRIIPLSSELAMLAADASIEHKLPMADSIIYATAQYERAIVVTSDEHFQGLPDVEYISKS